jgi:hypothetical protein
MNAAAAMIQKHADERAAKKHANAEGAGVTRQAASRDSPRVSSIKEFPDNRRRNPEQRDPSDYVR